MTAFVQWLRARVENVAAFLLAAMFLSFMLQIISRYVLNISVIWTTEACLTTWLWVVFLGSAFLLEERDQVKFDLIYGICSLPVQRVLALVSAVAISLGFLAALPATLDYITFYKIKSSSTLGIRLDVVFSVYGIFAVAIIIHYGVRAWRLINGVSPHDLEGEAK
jgi:TRAP-type C4-dicarboxylate transport system permease small subunit